MIWKFIGLEAVGWRLGEGKGRVLVMMFMGLALAGFQAFSVLIFGMCCYAVAS